MKYTNDQDRLWGERGIERQPFYYEYPNSGYQPVILYEQGTFRLVQVNDYSNRNKTYYVLDEDRVLLETKIRSEADALYLSKLDQKEAI